MRPSVPKKAALRDTELAGELKAHRTEYKDTIDAVRIACANVECELALRLRSFLQRPREAKRVLQNLLKAPGRVAVNARTVTVILQPAGTKGEREASAHLLDDLATWPLTLPGDPRRRRLRFRLQAEG